METDYQFVSSAKLPTRLGEFVIHAFVNVHDQQEHVALTTGEWKTEDIVPIRIHSECLTGDALFSTRCDCGFQLEKAMQAMIDQGLGALLYLRQEGRGIGLANKVRAYNLQDQGYDTVEANEHLGFDADLRDYSVCKVIFDKLNITRVSIMTNNPKKIAAIEEMGIDVVERRAIDHGITEDNLNYLRTKNAKLGHVIDPKKLK